MEVASVIFSPQKSCFRIFKVCNWHKISYQKIIDFKIGHQTDFLLSFLRYFSDEARSYNGKQVAVKDRPLNMPQTAKKAKLRPKCSYKMLQNADLCKEERKFIPNANGFFGLPVETI